MTKQEYIEAYWPAAIAACTGSPIFPILALAESAVESAWGGSHLTLEANNFFGTKSTDSWEAAGGQFVFKPTREVIKGENVMVQAKFRKYDTPKACFENFVHFVTQPGYVACGVVDALTPEEQIRCIAKKYATDPLYADKIIGTMHSLKALLPVA